MSATMRALLLALTMLAALPAAQAQPANPPAAAVPLPPDEAASAGLPQAGDSNAQRAKTQPGNNAPFWRAVRDSGNQAGYSSLPGVEQGVLIQQFVQYPGSRLTNAGEAWREVRNRWIIPYGGALLLIVIGAMALFYWRKGPLGGHEANVGRHIERFTPFERSAHWANAAAFVILAVSGVVVAFGKFFLLPLIGGTLFGWLTYVLKTAHNFAGPLFAVSLVIVFFTFVRDNLPRKGDLHWLLRFGGMLGDHEIPSHRFNAAEKLLFWGGVFLFGAVVIGSGLVLDKLVPGLEYTRGQMQVAHMIHAVATVLMIAMFLGHIYIGTIGMRGAYDAMRTGQVDEGWAKEHHEWWYEDVKAGKIPAQRSAAEAPPQAATQL